MRLTVLTALAFSLAACSQAAEEPEPDAELTQQPMPVEPDGGIGDGAAPLPESAADGATEAEITGPNESLLEEDARRDAAARGIGTDLIPADYHGIWDYVDGSCLPESDLRLEIKGDRILFYESVGTLTALKAMPNGDKVVTLAMEGEGETWTETYRLQMDSTAMRLVILLEEDQKLTPYSARKRCAS